MKGIDNMLEYSRNMWKGIAQKSWENSGTYDGSDAEYAFASGNDDAMDYLCEFIATDDKYWARCDTGVPGVPYIKPQSAKVRCDYCGVRPLPNDRFCEGCGAPV